MSERRRWVEVVILERPGNTYPFLVRAMDEQGWMILGEFRERQAAEARAAEARK